MYQETFLDCLFDFPVCNHTQGISNKNKGYYRGMIADYGIPLEAELCIYVKNGNIQKEVSIILPNLLFDDLDDISEKMLHTKEVINYRKNETCIDYFILDIGMVNKGEERQFDVTERYVNFLEDNYIIAFCSDMRNGSVTYLTDCNGNNLVKVIISLVDNGIEVATTKMNFFPYNERKHDKFTLLK